MEKGIRTSLKGLKRVSSGIKSLYKLRLNKIHKFKPKIEIYHEVGPFVLKTITNPKELKAALQLRYQVFHREMLEKKSERGIDVDEFDFQCDHLIIQEKKSGRIVGTYRFNSSAYTEKFYSANEFNLDRLLKHDGVKIELGRACIHKDFRRGAVIALLWKGIADYMIASKAQFLFGCGSIKTTDPREAALLHKYFIEQNRIVPEYLAPPTMAFKMPGLELWIQKFKNPLTDAEREEAENLVPPLLRTYLKIGCYIGGEPAWDEEFKCIDFLTILDKEDLNKSLWKKYKLDSDSPTNS